MVEKTSSNLLSKQEEVFNIFGTRTHKRRNLPSFDESGKQRLYCF